MPKNLNTKSKILFKIFNTVCVTFLYKKARHFTLRNFSWKSWNLYLYTKTWHLVLRYICIYKNQVTLQKSRQFVLHLFVQKAWHFALRDFHGIFEIGGGVEKFLFVKNNALCVAFVYAKNDALCVTFLFSKIQTLCVVFLYSQINSLCVTFLYIICFV